MMANSFKDLHEAANILYNNTFKNRIPSVYELNKMRDKKNKALDRAIETGSVQHADEADTHRFMHNIAKMKRKEARRNI